MKYLNKLATAFCSATLGLMLMTSCEGADLFTVGSPDWLSEKIDSIAKAKAGEVGPLYTFGQTDFSSGWWADFSKYYVIPAGEIWEATFDLHIDPSASNTYKNFALIICSDAERGGGSYKEYGAIRYDNQPSGNSEWGDYIDRSLVESTLTFETDTDSGVDKLGGMVHLTVDRSGGGLIVTMDNGTVKKTYTQTAELPNLNADATNTNIRCFMVVEGSYIDFWTSNIEAYDENAEHQPLAMTLSGVPRKVLLGSSFEEVMANVSATVDFEDGASKTVKAENLTLQSVDLNTLGTKTLVAVYNKTFKGENANKPIIATVEFEVVDKMYKILGNADNSTGWWEAHSEMVRVAPKETLVNTFTNYTNGAANWNNFLWVLTNQDGTTEYAVLRADNYGWGTGYDACTPSGGQADWGAWLAAMDGAKVTSYVTNNGDGTADVKAVMLGTDGVTYEQSYLGIQIDSEDFYAHFTIEGGHLEYDDVLGEEDNSTGWWVAHSPYIYVPVGETYTRHFTNYTNGAANWNNFLVVLTNNDGTTEYSVLRADNYGWGTGYDVCTPSGGQADWGAWLAAMDEASVTVSVTNNGSSADVKCVMVGSDGVTYYQDYIGISPIDGEDFFFHFTCEGSHLVFE